MEVATLLHDSADEILAAAHSAVERTQLKNYIRDGKEHTSQRLKALFVLTTRAVKERNLGPMIAHAETVARERFGAGYDIAEVQTAFNVLEEAMWTKIVHALLRGIRRGAWTRQHGPRCRKRRSGEDLCRAREQVAGRFAESSFPVCGDRRSLTGIIITLRPQSGIPQNAFSR